MTISADGTIVTADACAELLLGLSLTGADVRLKQLMPFPLNQPHRRMGSAGEPTMTVGHITVPALPLACGGFGCMLLVYLRHKLGALEFRTSTAPPYAKLRVMRHETDSTYGMTCNARQATKRHMACNMGSAEGQPPACRCQLC